MDKIMQGEGIENRTEGTGTLAFRGHMEKGKTCEGDKAKVANYSRKPGQLYGLEPIEKSIRKGQ